MMGGRRSRLRIAVLAVALLLAVGCRSKDRDVVVYVSIDQQLAEPILHRFESSTGISVRAVYDTEATKTTGLVNRLLAERSQPKADVFWNSEVVRTVVLMRAEALTPYLSPSAKDLPATLRDTDGYWTGQALRARALVWRRDRLDSPVAHLEDLVDPSWRGRVAMAYPLFGTTSSHIAALFASWGPDRTREWLRGLAANEVRIVDGNSTARDLVVAGAVDLALTDTDDFAVAVHRGEALEMAFADADDLGTFVIPSTVALIRGGPNPETGRRLIDYLLSAQVEQALVEGEGAFLPIRPSTPWPRHMPDRAQLRELDVDWEAATSRLDQAMIFCRDLFVRR